VTEVLTPSLILVSGRFLDPSAPHTRDAAFAHALAERGCDVRWVVPVHSLASTPELAQGSAVRLLPVVSPAPGFAAVQSRLVDAPTDSLLMESVRRELPDLVHVLGYGGCTSVNLSWGANRLGVNCVVSMESAAVICHRGDLLYRGREECRQFDSPDRCSACCLSPNSHGLSLWGSMLGRVLNAVRAPVNPYPVPIDFVTRQELLLGGLQFAERVIVTGEDERDRISSLGIRREMVEQLPPIGSESDSIDSYLDFYKHVIDKVDL
jgi:hypothetical protein